jgi:hypothetical protein
VAVPKGSNDLDDVRPFVFHKVVNSRYVAPLDVFREAMSAVEWVEYVLIVYQI